MCLHRMTDEGVCTHPTVVECNLAAIISVVIAISK